MYDPALVGASISRGTVRRFGIRLGLDYFPLKGPSDGFHVSGQEGASFALW